MSEYQTLLSISWIGVLASAHIAAADPAQLTSDEWPVHAEGVIALEGGFVTGFPTALPTGLSRGVGVSASASVVGPLRLGVRVAWLTARESSITWDVTHSDAQLRATAGLEHVAGRGRIGLRLGAGGTLVHESRLRAQGMRAGLMGDALATSAFSLVPAADLEAVIGISVYGPWSLALAGGPSVALLDRELHPGWVAQIGIGWRP